MARRNIIECDRCKREIKLNRYKGQYDIVRTGTVIDGTIYLCDSCGKKLEKFMSGQDCMSDGYHTDEPP
jgi:DNA-directed RNA polymerase subunit RPC12/RpoP